MDRPYLFAGKFYPGTKQEWEMDVRGYMRPATHRKQAFLAMVPHAGYMYSGSIAGRTLTTLVVPETVLLLGPNHTGMGAPFAVWPSGSWLIPGAHLDVDAQLAQAILDKTTLLQGDHQAHLQEHSLEVLLPFLWAINPNTRIVPISVSETQLDHLLKTASELADILQQWNTPVLTLVSSDMSHFISAEQAQSKDSLALQAIQDMDPEKLYSTVRNERISMCGMLPMTVGLAMAKKMGASQAEVVTYGSSGDASGDYSQVVGYAGVVVR